MAGCGPSLTTSVYHPHFTERGVMDSLLHATQAGASESALPCGHGEFPAIADPKLGELKLRTEVGMTLRAIGH